jgi:hypothetical protein
VTVSSSGVVAIPSSATTNGVLYTITVTANDGSGSKATFGVQIPSGSHPVG